jgi:5-methyltetrahydrofolate--homocysteine methyltransferase
MNNSLLDALKSEVPLIMDGAMGTELERRETHISSEDWVSLTLRTMKDTEAVHSEYALAGAKLHIANTFATARHNLDALGLGKQFETKNRDAVSICRRASRLNGNVNSWVAGSVSTYVIGGLRNKLPSSSKLLKNSQDQAAILAEAGCDMIVLETLHDVETTLILMEAAADTGLPISVGLTVLKNTEGQIVLRGLEMDQDNSKPPLRNALQEISNHMERGYPWILTIMHSGLEETSQALKLITENWDGMTGIYPNSGTWQNSVGLDYTTACTPRTFLKYAKSWGKNGASFIGGCCGIGPDHIKEIVKFFQ